VLIDLVECNASETITGVGTDAVVIAGLTAERAHVVVRPFTGGASSLTLEMTFGTTETCSHHTFIALEAAAPGGDAPKQLLTTGVGR
jgi:hypothetical protein